MSEEEEDLFIRFEDSEGRVIFEADFRPFIGDLREYAERFGLSLRAAAESIIRNLVENLALDPEGVVETFKNGNPWLFQFILETGGRVEVDLTTYVEEVERIIAEEQCTMREAAKAVLMANIETLRPSLRWIDEGSE